MGTGKIRLITILIIIGLSGVIAVQVIWISRSVKVSSRTMDQSVSEALQHTSQRLEEVEMLRWVSKDENGSDSLTMVRKLTDSDEGQTGEKTARRPLRVFRKISREGLDTGISQRISVQMDSVRSEMTRIEIESSVESQSDVSAEDIVADQEKKLRASEEKLIRIELKHERIDSMLEKLVLEISDEPLAWEERISDSVLRYFLAEEFSAAGLPGNYEYRVSLPGSGDSTLLISDGFEDAGPAAYEVPLFRNEILSEPARLAVIFPSRTGHVLRAMIPLLLLSLLLSIFLIVAAVAAIVTMYRQKRISQVKSDLISNISHEFRTPLATISLATDAINDEKVVHNPTAIREYTSVIRQENLRMQEQVDRVLHMALIDRKQLEMSLSYSDVHALIRKVTASMQLQATHLNGSLQLSLQAGESNCLIDPSHVHNVMVNLIDNALKYSRGLPDVSISTYNTDTMLVIEVSDKGIGMDKMTQQRIFDRFYRAETGNIHNVKGFGLGLSYVRTVVHALGGTISVESTVGEGSCFILRLPFSVQTM